MADRRATGGSDAGEDADALSFYVEHERGVVAEASAVASLEQVSDVARFLDLTVGALGGEVDRVIVMLMTDASRIPWRSNDMTARPVVATTLAAGIVWH